MGLTISHEIPEGMEEGFIESECTQQVLVLGKRDY